MLTTPRHNLANQLIVRRFNRDNALGAAHVEGRYHHRAAVLIAQTLDCRAGLANDGAGRFRGDEESTDYFHAVVPRRRVLTVLRCLLLLFSELKKSTLIVVVILFC